MENNVLLNSPDTPAPDNEGDALVYFGPGVVKFFEKSYGFIQDSNRNDYLVHWKHIESTGFRTLAKCQKVTFYGFLNPEKGMYAKKVRVVNG